MKNVLISIFMISGSAAMAEQSVMVGGDATLDACSAVGVVSGLKPVAGNFLALRAAGNANSKMIAKLENGQQLFICEEKSDWIGVVVPNEKDANCGVTSPIAQQGSYTGDCASGWVYRKYVELLAG